MKKLGLALSGGGFRATLYHLGVVRFLKDAGVLENITDIASVSGGSILAAHLALNWDRYNNDDQRFDEAAAEVVRFVQFDVRNHIVRRMPLQFPLRTLANLTRRQARNLTPNAVLERYYRDLLYGDRCLYELPEQPKLHILTTNVSNGGLSAFNRDGLYIQQRGDGRPKKYEHIAGTMASIPRVVGASSAFPGFFPPVEITAADLGVRDGQFPAEYFTDGGVYDNLGLRAFSWLKNLGYDFQEVYVSDAGKPFQILSDTSLGFVGQSVRASDILWDRVWQLEKENFGSQDGFVFMPITERVDLSEDPLALHPVIQAEVQSIRTDLDRFSDTEVNALAQHGYEVARKMYKQGPGRDMVVPDGPIYAPVEEERLPCGDYQTPSNDKELAAPPTVVARQLRGSASRRVWSTLLSLRDWPSYVYLALAAFLFGYVPFQVYQLYDRAQVLATINDAISQGDPDIRRVLDLVTEDPTKDWVADPIEEVSEPIPANYMELNRKANDGVEVMSHSRIIDLQRWRPTEEEPAKQGKVYVADRVQLRLLSTYTGDRQMRIALPLTVDDIEFRQTRSERRAIIRRYSEPIQLYGSERTLFELVYDLKELPIGEPVVLDLEMLVRISSPKYSARFTTQMKTDLISMWMLFPEQQPYRAYSLVQYPADQSAPPAVLSSRYQIDHPYGSLIGWSVVNPEQGNVYECRWRYE